MSYLEKPLILLMDKKKISTASYGRNMRKPA